MTLRGISRAIMTQPKWAAAWYLVNSTVCGITMMFLARGGYVPFDEMTAFLLGFFVPIGVYGIKETMGLWKYQGRLLLYQQSEVVLHRGVGFFGHGRYEEALEQFAGVLEEMPGHKRAVYYVAMCYERMNLLDEAARYYSEYLLLEPNDIVAKDKLARMDNLDTLERVY